VALHTLRSSVSHARFRLSVVGVVVAFLITACSGDTPPAATTEAQVVATPIATAATEQSATTAPPVEVTDDSTGPVELTVWWPDVLRPPSNTAIDILLDEQIRDFESAHTDVVVNSRLKRVGVTGGIMSTLRAAAPVAPGALPDVTLLPRESLIVAVQSELIQPIEGLVSFDDLFPSVLVLGEVEDQLYGVPYVLNVHHVMYPTTITYTSSDFSTIIANEVPMIFPIANDNGINEVFLTQYFVAANRNGGDTQNIDPQALRSTLNFYENAAAKELIDGNVIDYTSPEDYREILSANAPIAASVTPRIYLDLTATGQRWQVASLPSASGQPMTPLDGWMWVIVTPNVERQALALEFVMWMMEAERQSAYNQMIGLVPSQRGALRRWGNDAAYSEFIAELLEHAIILPPSLRSGTLARVMQDALVAVVSGESSAEAAAQSVMAQLAN